jgi:molybdopterin-synthase adenylyltransferase
LRRNENVFAFSLGCASLEIAQFISMVTAPGGIVAYGAHMFHLANGSLCNDVRGCEATCLYSGPLLGAGDTSEIVVTARHPSAEAARDARRTNAGADAEEAGMSSVRWRDRIASRARRWLRLTRGGR